MEKAVVAVAETEVELVRVIQALHDNSIDAYLESSTEGFKLMVGLKDFDNAHHIVNLIKPVMEKDQAKPEASPKH